MTDLTFAIRWLNGVEFIQLADLERHEDVIPTFETWGGQNSSSTVCYAARILERPSDDIKKKWRIRYDRNLQKDAIVRKFANDIPWGETTLSWNSVTGRASAKFVDDAGRWTGSAELVTVFDSEGAQVETRRKGSVSIILRPQQAILRDRLLKIDKACALSSESEASALEVAHLVAVKYGGPEETSNAILLRADLHRLFDRGLIWFESSDDKAFVRFSQMLSGNYLRVLSGRELHPSTFRRVKGALGKLAKVSRQRREAAAPA